MNASSFESTASYCYYILNATTPGYASSQFSISVAFSRDGTLAVGPYEYGSGASSIHLQPIKSAGVWSRI